MGCCRLSTFCQALGELLGLPFVAWRAESTVAIESAQPTTLTHRHDVIALPAGLAVVVPARIRDAHDAGDFSLEEA